MKLLKRDIDLLLEETNDMEEVDGTIRLYEIDIDLLLERTKDLR